MSTSPLQLDPIIIAKARGASFLDIGCGYGKWGFLVKNYFWGISGNYTSQPVVVGLDIFYPHLKSLRKSGIYTALINSDAPRLPFRSDSFDTVIAVEVIEHMDKSDGLAFIDNAYDVAKKRLIITTPNFKCFRDAITGLDGKNKHEAHKSFWRVAELRKLGFKCYGTGVRLTFHPILQTVFGSLTYFFPRLSLNIIAIKDKN